MRKKKSVLKSKIQRKIMQFFLENPRSIDTPRGVSTWINENIHNVRSALEALAEQGLLKAHRTSSTVGYSCALDRKKLSKISSLSGR